MRSITYLPDGYQFDVPEAALSMQFRNIQTHSKELWAEIEIYQTLSGERKNHHWSGLNLLAATSKTSLAKEMSRKVPSYEGWGELIESLCYQAAQEYRKPNESEAIGLTEPPPRTWRLWPFIEGTEPSILFGSPEAGKTYLALLQALSIQSGIAIVDFKPIQGNVLYIDYEADRDTLERRIRRICRGMSLPYIALEYYKPVGSIAQEVATLRAIVRNKNIQHTITDSALKAAGGSLENTEQVGKCFTAYSALGTSNTIIAHVAKNNQTNQRTVFGSTFWTAMARSVWEIIGSREDDSPVLEQGIKHVKGNDIARQPRRGYEWRFAVDEYGEEALNSIAVHPQSIAKMSGLESLHSPVTKITNAIENLDLCKGTIAEIAAAAEMSEGAVKMAISRNSRVFVNLEPQKRPSVYGLLSKRSAIE